ncbi:MAG: fimbrial biogenesis chaperone [Mucilaginibacter sp.]
MLKPSFVSVLLFCSLLTFKVFGQAGMTVSPSKLYYKLPAGGTGTQKVTVANPNNSELEVGVSLSDWDYDAFGNNVIHEMGSLKTSCAEWIRVLPGAVFNLQPNERRELQVVFNVPPNADQSIPVHTAMLFLTQMNPADSRASNGTAVKVSVRIGIKVYHSFIQSEKRDLEVIGLKDTTIAKPLASLLELQVENTGKLWVDGKVKWELLNTQTGGKIKMDEQDFYALPGDKRIIRQNLPTKLEKGHYTATAVINYGNNDELKVAELEFER